MKHNGNYRYAEIKWQRGWKPFIKEKTQMAKDKQWGSINSYFRNASLATINISLSSSKWTSFIRFFILIPWLEIKSGCNSLE